MRRKVAGAVVLVVAGLACSACGNFLLSGVPSGSGSTQALTVVPSTSTVMRTLVSRSGSGSKTIGVFAVRGQLHYKASCKGPGQVVFNFEHPRPSSKADESDGCNHVSAMETTLSSFHGGHARISVQASADTRWTLVVWETYKE